MCPPVSMCVYTPGAVTPLCVCLSVMCLLVCLSVLSPAAIFLLLMLVFLGVLREALRSETGSGSRGWGELGPPLGTMLWTLQLRSWSPLFLPLNTVPQAYLSPGDLAILLPSP